MALGTKNTKEFMTFMPGDKQALISSEETVLEVALHNNIELNHSCGGMGSCGTCRVVVEAERLSQRTEVEQEMADDRGFAVNERLACQLSPQSGLILEIP